MKKKISVALCGFSLAVSAFLPMSAETAQAGTAAETQFQNRMILRRAMMRHGFRPLDTEWWHFTLNDEPYPDTYFTFPVRRIP